MGNREAELDPAREECPADRQRGEFDYAVLIKYFTLGELVVDSINPPTQVGDDCYPQVAVFKHQRAVRFIDRMRSDIIQQRVRIDMRHTILRPENRVWILSLEGIGGKLDCAFGYQDFLKV